MEGIQVQADATALQQVLVNLALNACDAMPDGGNLLVRLGINAPDEGNKRAVLTVRDTGSGMAPEVLARAFDAYFSTKPPEKGTGLGLWLTREIVSEHGGEIEVDSHSGKGTRFTISLPASVAQRSAGDRNDDQGTNSRHPSAADIG